MTPVLKSKSEIESLVNRAIGGYAAACRDLHEAAWQATVHALTHGDTTILSRMLEQLGKKQAAQDIAAWVRHFGAGERKAISAKVGGKNGVTVKVGKVDDRSQFPIEEAFDTPYYSLFEGRTTKTEWEWRKSLIAFVKKAAKDESATEDMMVAVLKDTYRQAKSA